MLARNKAIWLKQITIWIMAFVIAISFVQTAQAGTVEQYERLTGEEKFIEIKDGVTHSAQNIYKCRASDVYKELEKASHDFQKISYIVQKSENIDDVIDKVADKFDKIANTYEKISNYSSDISSIRKTEFANLIIFKRETYKTEEELKNEIAQIKSKNSSINRQIESVLDEIERKKLEVSLKGNKSVINSLNAQRIIWEKFYQAQVKMLKPLKLNAKKIDLLLHILSVNSGVYHEAANVARLRRSAKSALENLGALADVQDVIFDLEDSWIEVSDIVSEISQAEFTIDIE